MIASGKQRIIKSQGTQVTITSVSGQTTTTPSIIGRASKQFNNILSLEAHRRGHFLPTVNLDNGFLVNNSVLNEDYLCVAVYPEVFGNSITATVAHMLLCNTLLTVKRESKVGDDRGRITLTFTNVIENKKVYMQKLTQDLKLLDPGLVPTADYLIYTPTANLQLLDKVVVTNSIQTLNLKIEALDQISYPGLSVIQLALETRV